MRKIPVTILGATGMVGQKLVELLIDHPQFEIKTLAASNQSAYKKYIDCVDWKGKKKLPLFLQNKIISPCDTSSSAPLVFSALSSDVAFEIEASFLKQGCHVISNAKCFRMHPHVPLMIPEVNFSHIQLIEAQNFPGKIITNPNCAVSGLALALAPLFTHFGVEKLHVCTMQSISGAGLNTFPSYIENNIVPHIEDEEEKVESEPQKILGTFKNSCIVPALISISAQCNRVPTLNGHFMNISVQLTKKTSIDEIKKSWLNYQSSVSHLPSGVQNPFIYFDEKELPQPNFTPSLGMNIALGKLQACSCLDFKFNLLVDNLVRGAAGAALLNAELFLDRYPNLININENSSVTC